MAEASKSLVMNVAIGDLWKVITDYAKYPEFVKGAEKVKVGERKKGTLRVDYEIQMLGKDIAYSLEHIESEPGKMDWHLIESNIFKNNTGAWNLKELGTKKTEATYTLSLEFKIFVPGMILSGLVKSQLPEMLESFEKRTLKIFK